VLQGRENKEKKAWREIYSVAPVMPEGFGIVYCINMPPVL